jgi:hypothetical protein
VGLTLGEWLRNYHQPWHINEPTPEDIAWGIIDVTGWPASPELLMWLTEHIENQIGRRVHFKSDSTKIIGKSE